MLQLTCWRFVIWIVINIFYIYFFLQFYRNLWISYTKFVQKEENRTSQNEKMNAVHHFARRNMMRLLSCLRLAIRCIRLLNKKNDNFAAVTFVELIYMNLMGTHMVRDVYLRANAFFRPWLGAAIFAEQIVYFLWIIWKLPETPQENQKKSSNRSGTNYNFVCLINSI